MAESVILGPGGKPWEAAKTAESAAEPIRLGEQRAQAAKEWLSDRFDGAKSTVSRVSGFLRKVGVNLLEADKTAVDTYKFVDKKTSAAAVAAGERMGKAYAGAVERKDRIVDATTERYNKTVDTAKQKRDSIVAGIKDQALQARMYALSSRRSAAEAGRVRSDNIVVAHTARRESYKQTIDGIDAAIAELRGRLTGGAA